jgi:hypothetical protein
MKDRQTPFFLLEQVKEIREDRLARQAKTPPAVLAEQRRRKAEVRPRAELLMSEFGMNPPEAWLLANDDPKWFQHLKAHEKVRAAEASPTRASSSIALISPRREDAPPPTPEMKPGESYETFKRRIGAHVSTLAQSAGQARGLDVADNVGFTEKTEEAYATLKAAEKASPDAHVREIVHHATAAGSVNLAESTGLKNKALGRMKARGESVDPHSQNFSERYKRALLEENPK